MWHNTHDDGSRAEGNEGGLRSQQTNTLRYRKAAALPTWQEKEIRVPLWLASVRNLFRRKIMRLARACLVHGVPLPDSRSARRGCFCVAVKGYE
jgi:hypothetical protein